MSDKFGRSQIDELHSVHKLKHIYIRTFSGVAFFKVKILYKKKNQSLKLYTNISPTTVKSF